MKHKLIVGNWKMHGIIPEASIMIEKLKKELGEVKKTEVVKRKMFFGKKKDHIQAKFLH